MGVIPKCELSKYSNQFGPNLSGYRAHRTYMPYRSEVMEIKMKGFGSMIVFKKHTPIRREFSN